MSIRKYLDNERYVLGTTMKDVTALEENNMALHICENPEYILENRKRLAEQLQCDLDDFICANQTHSANFHKVTVADKGRGARLLETAIKDTDALYTFEPDLLLCSFTADCVPVIFYNEKNNLVGVVHSGWQGTVKEITRKLFEYLKQHEHCNPNDFHVQIGSALSQEKFEVDEDVYKKFKDLGYANDFMYYKNETGKFHIDNQLTVQKQCELAGIPLERISIDRTCTFLNPDGFSHREDRNTGRHLSFIMRKK